MGPRHRCGVMNAHVMCFYGVSPWQSIFMYNRKDVKGQHDIPTVYKCMGANDKIFDHCLSLNSAPTIPVHVNQPLIMDRRYKGTDRSVWSQSALPSC